ncbi:MAG TPA: TIGR03084 family metal-binding protein [Candidatus Binataceae bacterium]|nr:TIGR03084 family metal-binding protein [Candidatus Binataceae bacterium]
MLEQADDFQAESDQLLNLLEQLDEPDWQRETQFKRWTINDLIAHLHLFNHAADLALRDPKAFGRLIGELNAAVKHGATHLAFTHAWLAGSRNRELMKAWRDFYRAMAARFRLADPKTRVPWAGPTMSVRSSITARLMETWAHGQAIYDLVGQTRSETDRIRNIAVLGINTFSWTFANRKMPVPENLPLVRLIAPSGAVWNWGTDQNNRIEGNALEFCQVVTQVRNIQDTKLTVVGPIAGAWMSIAQCFAGPPEEPPPAGARFVQSRSS